MISIYPILTPTSNGKTRAASHKLEELPLLFLIEIAQNFKQELNNFAIMAITMIRLALFMQLLHRPWHKVRATEHFAQLPRRGYKQELPSPHRLEKD